MSERSVSRSSISRSTRASLAVSDFRMSESEIPEANLPTPITRAEAELYFAGKLFKVSEHMRAWKPRYFILEDNRFIHFLDPTEARPRRIIKLDECELQVLSEPYYGKTAFMLRHPTFESDYILGTDSPEATRAWIERVQKAVAGGVGEEDLVAHADAPHVPEGVQDYLRDSLNVDPTGLSQEDDDEAKWILTEVDSSGARHWQKKSSAASDAAASDSNRRRVLTELGKLVLVIVAFHLLGYLPLARLLVGRDLALILLSALSVALVRRVPRATLVEQIQPASLMAITGFLLFILSITTTETAFPWVVCTLLAFLTLVDFDRSFQTHILQITATELKVSITARYCPEVIARAFLDLKTRSLWDPRLTRVRQVDRVAENKRIVQSTYASVLPRVLMEGYERTMEEEWYKVAPRKHIIVIRSAADASPSDHQRFEAAFVISPIDSGDSHIRSPSQVSLISRITIQHRLRSLLWVQSVPSAVSLHTFYGLHAYLKSLSTTELNRLRTAPLGGDHVDPQKLAQAKEKEYRQILRGALDAALAEAVDEKGYTLMVDRNDVKVYRKETSNRQALQLKSITRINKPAEVVMFYLSEITNKPSYDMFCKKAYFVRTYSPITKLVRQEFKPTFVGPGSVLTPTDALGVVDEAMPPDPEYVRATIEYGAYLFDILDESSCQVTFLVNTLFGSDLPSFVKDIAIQGQGMHLHQVRNLVRDMTMESIPDVGYVFESMAAADGVEVEGLRNLYFGHAEEQKEGYPSSANSAATGATAEQRARSASQEASHGWIQRSEEALEDIWRLANDESTWRFVKESSNVRIFKKESDNPYAPLVMGKGEIDAPPLLIAAVMADLSRKTTWDHMFEKGHEVKRLSHTATVVYQKYRGMLAVSARDLANATNFRILEDGTLVAAGTSIVHPDVPEIRGNVRANLIFGGMVARPIDEGKRSDVTYIVNLDLCGSIPGFVINMISTDQPLIVDQLRKAIVTLDAWNTLQDKMKESQDNWERHKAAVARGDAAELELVTSTSTPSTPRAGADATAEPSSSPPVATPILESLEADQGEHKEGVPAAPATPRITTETSSATTSASVSPRVSPRAPPANPATPSPRASGSPSRLELAPPPARFSVSMRSGSEDREREERDEEIKYPDRSLQIILHLEKADEAISQLLEVSDPAAGWSPLYEKHGVKVAQRSWQQHPCPVIKSSGLVSASPRDIAGVLSNLERRKWYDSFFTSARVLSEIDSHTRVYRVLYQSREFCGTSREFVVVDHWRELSDGKLIFAAKSVDHTDAPVDESVAVRAEALLVGWIIEPLTYAKDNKLKGSTCRVQYISQIDLKKDVPSWVASLAVKQQPLLVHDLDRLFH